MALYSYEKEVNTARRRYLTMISYTSMLLGSLFLFWSFYPVIAFEIYSRIFIKQNISSPIPTTQAASLEKSASVLGTANSFSTNLADFTKANVWFPTAKGVDTLGKDKPRLKSYRLSIPSINVEDAKVQIGGEDLLSGLVHYQSPSMPGEVGNIPIFGHSTLPQLHKKDDYKSIFTYLPTIESGAKVYADVGDVRYTYKVYDKFVVKPSQISVLNQEYDDSYLTLVTCVPLGTYWNRLVVKAKLTELPR